MEKNLTFGGLLVEKSALVGKWFHSFKDDKLCWQGRILSQEQDSFFLIETYDWVGGEAFNMQLVNFKDMADWRFYPTNDNMIFHAKRYTRDV